MTRYQKSCIRVVRGSILYVSVLLRSSSYDIYCQWPHSAICVLVATASLSMRLTVIVLEIGFTSSYRRFQELRVTNYTIVKCCSSKSVLVQLERITFNIQSSSCNTSSSMMQPPGLSVYNLSGTPIFRSLFRSCGS